MELKKIYGRKKLAQFLGVRYSAVEYHERQGAFRYKKNVDFPGQLACVYEPKEIEKAYQYFSARGMLNITDAEHIR